MLHRVSNYSWGQLLSGSKMCSMSSNWCLFSSKKTMRGNSRLHCLPKETFCHPETSAFYLKNWRRNRSIFEIHSLSIEHQRKENKIGYEGSFCSLIHTLFSFSLLGGKGSLLGWKVLLLLNFSIYTDLHTYRKWLLCPSSSVFAFSGEARWSLRAGVCVSEFCGEVDRLLWVCPSRCNDLWSIVNSL